MHDCFSVTEAQHLAALGFCAPKTTPAYLRSGATERDGARPINPTGGLLGGGHPVGATGVRQVVDAWKQGTVQAGRAQLPTRPRVQLTSNIGGDDRTAVVTLLRSP